MYHQDKFLLRQFNHLNRSIQELKDKREVKEESEVNCRYFIELKYKLTNFVYTGKSISENV
jgi:hypothetical protein